MPASRPDQPAALSLDKGVHSHASVSKVTVDDSLKDELVSAVFVDGVSTNSAHLVWTAPVDNGCPITSMNLLIMNFLQIESSGISLCKQRTTMKYIFL